MWLSLLAFSCFALVGYCDDNCAGNGVYNELFNKCYYFFNEPEIYNEAAATCRGMNGRLVTIHNAFEQTLVFGQARQKFPSYMDYWIGLTKSANSWIWSDGSSPTFTFWETGCPMEYDNFNCVAALSNSGRWYDTLCDENIFSFVCESVNSSEPSTIISTASPTATAVSPDGWTYYNVTDSWYKGLLDKTADWEGYEALCKSGGGHLASIHSDAEAHFVQNLEWWVSVYVEMEWIGLHTASEPPYEYSIFTDGTPMDYTNWKGYKPDLGPNKCVVLYPMGDWMSVDCADKGYAYGAVCKRPNKKNLQN